MIFHRKKIKAYVFCTSYFNDRDRYSRWINHHEARLAKLGADQLILIDDASQSQGLGFDSQYPIINADRGLPDKLPTQSTIVTFDEHYGRQDVLVYPGWWRSFTYSLIIAEKYNYEKIIHVESDFYILSNRIMRYIANVRKGWTVMWSRKYEFPETAIQIICKDQFDKIRKIYQSGKQAFVNSNEFAERVLPFTKVQKKFIGDRFGEHGSHRGWAKGVIPPRLDYIGQVQLAEGDADKYKTFA